MGAQPRWAILGCLLAAGCHQAAPVPSRPATAPHTTQTQVQTGETIVRLRPGTSPRAFAQRHGLTWVRAIGLAMHLFRGGQNPSALGSDHAVVWAEPNYRFSLPQLASAPSPQAKAKRGLSNDPLLPAQYALTITGADKAWEVTNGSPQVVVAVIDSGVDGSHPELQGQLLPGMDFSDEKLGPQPGGDKDGYGHGTHVAGVIAAKRDNGTGVAGLAPGCKILPVRIFNNWGHTYSGASAAAIIWAVDHGAKVINASWGTPLPGDVGKAAYDYALSKDVVFVAAAGNTGKNDENFPAAHPGVLSIAASNDIDGWAAFSSWGDWMALAAPGEGILSTFPVALGNGYRIMSGTSMAAPQVTAAAALVRSRFPQLTQQQVGERLKATAKDVILTGIDPYSGHGRVDIGRAICDPLP